MSIIDPEFSRVITLSKVPEGGKEFTYTVDETARTAIAKRFKIPSVNALSATLLVTPSINGAFIRGTIKADLTRDCVASLEPVEELIEEPIEVEFDRTLKDDDEATIMEQLASGNYAEPLEGDEIDLGEFMVQQLSLAMDPFPRKPGAQSLSEQYGTSQIASPFAVLKGIVTDKKSH